LYIEDPLGIEELKRGLRMYSILKVGDKLMICGARKTVNAEVLSLGAHQICIMNQDNFELTMTHEHPGVLETSNMGTNTFEEPNPGPTFGIYSI
jgi:hypothetical protein